MCSREGVRPSPKAHADKALTFLPLGSVALGPSPAALAIAEAKGFRRGGELPVVSTKTGPVGQRQGCLGWKRRRQIGAWGLPRMLFLAVKNFPSRPGEQ